MQARLREEQQKRTAGWLQWFRRPVLSVAAALCLVAGLGVLQVERFLQQGDAPPVIHTSAPTGTAVSDLQYLDKNSDLLQNFDALDYMDGDADINDSN
jgi:hypothetical protein